MQPKKSSFVNTLSWILIIISGFGLLISLLQNLMFHLIPAFTESMNPSDPDMLDKIFTNGKLIVGFFGLAILYTFISSIGLLKRKNWARISLICLFVFWMLWTIITPTIQWIYFFEGDSLSLSTEPKDIIGIIVTIFLAIIVVGLSFLFGWLIKKLSSKHIKAEFQ